MVEKGNPFLGRTIAVTGKLEHFTRDEINCRILELGGIPRCSVSRNTDYLICGTKSGSKLSKAHAFGTKIISEKEFLDITA